MSEADLPLQLQKALRGPTSAASGSMGPDDPVSLYLRDSSLYLAKAGAPPPVAVTSICAVTASTVAAGSAGGAGVPWVVLCKEGGHGLVSVMPS